MFGETVQIILFFYNFFFDMSLSGRANVTFALKMSHFATVPMLLYRGKVTAEHLVDDCETTLNHHRNKSKVTYHTNTHTQITDKNVTFTRTACACGTRGVYKIKCVICICIAFLYPFTMSFKSLFIQHAKVQHF